MDPLERQRLEEQLSAWLDGELSQPEQQELQRLLARSAEARALLAELQKTVGLVRQLPRASSPDDLYDSIVARLERTALLGPPARAALPAGRAWRWRGLWALAASAAVVLVALGVGYWFVGARSGVERDAGRPGRQLARGPEAAELKHPRMSPPAGELGRRPAGPGTQRPERPALPERLARKRAARRAGGGKEAERSGVGLAEAPVGPQAQLLRPRRRRPSRPPQPSAEPLARAAPAATAMVEADLAATRPARGSDRSSLARPGSGPTERGVSLDVLVVDRQQAHACREVVEQFLAERDLPVLQGGPAVQSSRPASDRRDVAGRPTTTPARPRRYEFFATADEVAVLIRRLREVGQREVRPQVHLGGAWPADGQEPGRLLTAERLWPGRRFGQPARLATQPAARPSQASLQRRLRMMVTIRGPLAGAPTATRPADQAVQPLP